MIRYYKEEEFKKIPKKNLMDFVIVNEDEEAGIIASWEKHFKANGIPYAIERQDEDLVLWKERRI